MKYTTAIPVLILFILCNAQNLNAQTLKVTYREKLDLTEKMRAVEDRPAVRQLLVEKLGKPKYYELISSDGKSVYQQAQNLNEEDPDNGVIVVGGGEQDIVYKNHKDRTYAKQTEFMSRTFLIEEKLKVNNWEIKEDTMKIGDYLCKKAMLEKDSISVVAWFTGEIPSNEGPGKYYGLPGLILKVETGKVTIEATGISFSKEGTLVERPAKGKKVTLKEFEKIREEKINSITGGKKKKGVQVIKMQ